MVLPPKFCSQCGKPVAAGMRFCTQCGAPIQAAPAPAPTPAQYTPPPPPAPPAEPIVGFVLNAQRRKGFMGMGADLFNIVLTPRRVVMVMVTTKTMQDAVMLARAEAKEQGKGGLGQWAPQMGWAQALARKYQTMTIEQILAEYPGSFFFENPQIHKVRVQMPSDDEANHALEVIIETAGDKQKFELQMGSTKDVKTVFQQTLGGVVR
ncbi:MAG TPA: zinc ribbon domain-containing protein [Anaerolineaceae bacterium]|nr:zinc ribbon domain-containing protein [Anaerolineaceae bacterium]